MQASGISANKKRYKFAFLYHFYKFKTKSDEIDTLLKTKNPWKPYPFWPHIPV